MANLTASYKPKHWLCSFCPTAQAAAPAASTAALFEAARRVTAVSCCGTEEGHSCLLKHTLSFSNRILAVRLVGSPKQTLLVVPSEWGMGRLQQHCTTWTRISISRARQQFAKQIEYYVSLMLTLVNSFIFFMEYIKRYRVLGIVRSVWQVKTRPNLWAEDGNVSICRVSQGWQTTKDSWYT